MIAKQGRAFRAFLTAVAEECYRVMKPGAHGLVWAIPRTSHWTATALEDAGFEVRDFVCHHFGQGFPKSLDVSKAIDKMAGAEREVVGPNPNYRDAEINADHHERWNAAVISSSVTAPATEAAKQWEGWGTALKPATEVWWLIRKPLAKPTVASQVLATGTGALNVDGCRVGGSPPSVPQWRSAGSNNNWAAEGRNGEMSQPSPAGRWPANLVLSCCGEEPHAENCAVAELDRQSGELAAGIAVQRNRDGEVHNEVYGAYRKSPAADVGYGGAGGASRFFYTAKASTSERSAGLHKPGDRNAHPTVKPTDLMRWLCRLVTPPGGVILDPFMGSGSTGVAARLEGFGFVGIEKDQESFATAEKRLGWAVHEPELF